MNCDANVCFFALAAPKAGREPGLLDADVFVRWLERLLTTSWNDVVFLGEGTSAKWRVQGRFAPKNNPLQSLAGRAEKWNL